MPRPKGSKNKPKKKSFTIAIAAEMIAKGEKFSPDQAKYYFQHKETILDSLKSSKGQRSSCENR